MKKVLLILFLAVTLAGCEKDETTELSGKASIRFVTFQPIATAGINRVKVTINLEMPEKGSVIQIDAMRGQSSFRAISAPVEGLNEFNDNSMTWPPSGSTLFYVFTLKHSDGTETVSKPYSVY